VVNAVTDEGAFIKFATVAERIKSARRRSEKAALLSQYFAQLHDDHLLHAVHYFTGYRLTGTSRDRSVQVGEVTVVSVLSILSGAEPAALSAQQSQLGDFGAVAAQVLTRHSHPVLTIEDVAIALEQLSKTKGKRKLGWVLRLLERATPLEAKYLVQLLLGDLQIGLEVKTVEVAIAQLSNQPLPRIQWVHTLLGDLGKTALLARHNQLDQARMQLFRPIKFMLASSLPDPVQLVQHLSRGFAIETKYDGIRVQAHIAPADRSLPPGQGAIFAGIRVALFSRTLEEITASFPDLVVPLAGLEPHALVTGKTAGLILDGEIVPYQDDRILPFTGLQHRLDNPSPAAELMAQVPVAFMAYDILYQDGTVLINQPYRKRRRALEALPLETPKVRLATAQRFADLEALEQQYLHARSQGQEGLMVKTLHSPYRPGRRSKGWLKMRQAIPTLDVVITAAEIVTSATRMDCFSHYAVAIRRSETDPTLLNIGKVSTGLTQDDYAALSVWLRQHIIEEFANGTVCLVEPQIVLEVTFERLQPSSRQRSGYVLEEPKILRIRHDKPVSEIDTLTTIVHLATAAAK
jgi:DNA ligase 1